MNSCKRIQDRLATDGPAALREDTPAQEHLVECENCYRFLESLDRIEHGLTSLEPLDAPDELVARLLEREELNEPPVVPEPETPWYRRPLLQTYDPRRVRAFLWGAGGLVSTVLLVVLFRPVTKIADQSIPEEIVTALQSNRESDRLTPEEEGQLRDLGYLSGPASKTEDANLEAQPRKSLLPPPVPAEEEPRFRSKDESAARGSKSSREIARNGSPPPVMMRQSPLPLPPVEEPHRPESVQPNSIEEMEVITEGIGAEFSFANIIQKHGNDDSPTWVIDGIEVTDYAAGEGGSFYFDSSELDKAGELKRDIAKQKAATTDRRAGKKIEGDRLDNYREIAQDKEAAVSEARRFLEARNTVEGIELRDAAGYWSNRYVPGDPLMRLLHARLAADLVGFDAQALHAAVRPAAQPLDAPRHAALSVQLLADRRATEGPSRTLIQVGLKGIEHQGGRRPAMNLAVVLHAGDDASDEVATGMRAIVDALNAARRPGDRFRLIVAGEPGGIAVDADRFRHGELLVALSRLFDPNDELEGPDWGMFAALSKAIGSVAEDDDPNATLGTSAVLIVTGRELDTNEDDLNALAHRSAVAGIPVGVMAVGGNAGPQQLKRLTIAGQGRFGVLLRPADAESLIDRELAAVSRAVARAVRLRIRLAPGVQLVDVVGSDRLDERAADRVRQSEQSLDLRLARNLGITADRGDDEDGIQIVIPNFYASDEHVILLDVVSPGAGPLVDVTARFKDLVHLKNGTVRASLSLDRGTDVQGRRELNVLKNYLAHLLSDTLYSAGNALARKDNASAEAQLLRHESFLAELSQLLPALSSDPEIRTDLAMLTSYRAALARSEMTPEQLSWLADSLRYASGARLHTPHPTERNPS